MGVHNSLYNLQFMSYLHSQRLIGQILAISGLALAAPCTLLGRHYSRTLYFAQFLFLFSSVFQTTSDPNFSMNLDFSWLSFMPSFTQHYCTPGDFSCDYGYLISPGLVWLGGAVAFLLIIKLIACKMPNLHFLKFYAFYRGLFHWFMGPLVYFSTAQIIKAIQFSLFDVSFTSAVIVLGVFVIIVIIELISDAVAQSQQSDPWAKWIYFSGHINVGAMMVIMTLYSYDSNASVAKYMLNIPLALYALLFLGKYKFMFKVAERVAVFLQDAIIITCYNIFAIKYDDIARTDLDFYALVIVAALQLVFLLPKLARFCIPRGTESQTDPEKREGQQVHVRRHPAGDYNLDNTHEALNGAQTYTNSKRRQR